MSTFTFYYKLKQSMPIAVLYVPRYHSALLSLLTRILGNHHPVIQYVTGVNDAEDIPAVADNKLDL